MNVNTENKTDKNQTKIEEPNPFEHPPFSPFLNEDSKPLDTKDLLNPHFVSTNPPNADSELPQYMKYVMIGFGTVFLVAGVGLCIRCFFIRNKKRDRKMQVNFDEA